MGYVETMTRCLAASIVSLPINQRCLVSGEIAFFSIRRLARKRQQFAIERFGLAPKFSYPLGSGTLIWQCL